jgi:hypothetical protein
MGKAEIEKAESRNPKARAFHSAVSYFCFLLSQFLLFPSSRFRLPSLNCLTLPSASTNVPSVEATPPDCSVNTSLPVRPGSRRFTLGTSHPL